MDLVISIDLCYSLFDTKVYVFDQDQNVIACNDDFYSGPPCGQFVSFIPELLLNGGETFFIIIDGYGGDFNGGCNSTLPVFQPLPVRTDGCVDLCGLSGWYTTGGIDTRDTDWFEAVGTGEILSINLIADSPIHLFVLQPDCSDLEPLAEGGGPALEPIEVSMPTVAGQLYWIWVGPQDYFGWVNAFEYVLTVCGLEEPVSSDRMSWGGVKTLYR